MTERTDILEDMPEKERLLSVGEVCALCRISRKTLFYYDRIGLLKPSLRKGSQNHKYYNREALRRLRRIIRYREAGISLKTIKSLLNVDRDGRLAILRAELENAKQRYTTDRKQCEEIEEMIREVCKIG